MLPALIVGGLTAWYLGLRAGIIAAAITFGLLLISIFVPGLNLAVYAVVISWCAALYFLGPKMSKGAGLNAGGGGMLGSVLGGAAGQAKAWLDKLREKAK